MTALETLAGADSRETEPDNCLAGYAPVRVTAIKLLPDFSCDLFIMHKGCVAPALYREKAYRADADSFSALEKRGCHTLYIRASDYRQYRKELDANLEDLLQREDVAVGDRFGVLQSAVADRVEHAFRLINCDKALFESKRIGEQISQLLGSRKTLPTDLFSVVQHDYYTFTHVTNVSGYCVLLAQMLGMTDQRDLDTIAVGGILHDLGKRLLPQSVLNKKTRLTSKEMRMIQTHPQKGFEELHDRSDLSFGQRMMVYQHHERIDGTGYPVRILGRDIHPWAKMCAVVDVFDALTCRRPYRRAVPVADALDYPAFPI